MNNAGSKPLILVSLSEYDTGATSAIGYGIRSTYVRKLYKYNLEPLFVSSAMPHESVDMFYDNCAGVLFVGGNDVDPALYGAERAPETEKSLPERDALELFILEKVLVDQKPFLGICRGCQVLNVACGGTLIQHIKETSVRHRLASEHNSYKWIVESSPHLVEVAKDSRAFEIMQKAEISTTSAHHQAADKVGHNLVASGKSTDGVIEILEHADRSFFCFGLEGHPEVEDSGDQENFFKVFAEAATKFST